MGLTMNQWDQLAGSGVEGYLDSQENRRDNEKNKREQDAEDRTATKWEQQEAANKTLQERIARQEFEAIVQASNTSREAVDAHWGPPTPAAGLSGGPAAPAAPAAPPPAAPVLPQGVAALPPPPTAPAQPVPALVGGIAGAPRMANGGAIEVGPEQMGPSQPQPQMGPPQQEALPTQPAQPAYKSRREEYQAWYKKAAAAHATAGGLEGLKMFRDQENALSRKQMLGYGMEGVSAMQAGNAGEAVKQLNTMLAVSPEDTGMEWQAYDGKVYLVGPNGKRGKPFNQAAVQGIIENNIKTPENYLAFQESALNKRKQTEVERAAPIVEATAQQRAEASTQVAATNQSQYKLDEKYRGRETAVEEAKALASLIQAKSAQNRAAALLASGSNWTAAQILKIYSDADTWSLTDEMIPPDMQKAFQEDPIAWGRHKSDVMNQMTKNDYDTGPTREEASAVSLFLRQPGGFNLNKEMAGIRGAQDPETKLIMIDYNGKQWALPYDLGAAALNLGIIQDAVEPPTDATAEESGGGGKEQPVLPVSGPPAPPPPGAPPLAREDEEAGYRYIKLQTGQWQLSNQQGDPVKSNIPPTTQLTPAQQAHLDDPMRQ